MKQVLKRDGSLEKWDTNKIKGVLKKALDSDSILDSESISKQLTEEVEAKFKWKRLVPQEEIQDLVEKILIEKEYLKAAKNFIIYREKRRIVRESGQLQIDIMSTMENYIQQGDWRVKENSNIQFSYQGLLLYLAETTQSKYCLNQYPEIVRNAHLQGFIHIHDLGFGLAPYCSGWSLGDLLREGFNNLGYSSSNPPKNFTTALNQIVNFIGTLQNEWAGAQALNNIDTYLAPFIRFGDLSYKEVYDNMQSFIFGLNITSRWGSQSPFSNLTLDVVCPNHMKNEPVIIGGKVQNNTYSEFQKEMDLFNKAFLEVLIKGDKDGRIFSFPIPTYNITKDFPWNSEFGTLLAKMTGKYGIPYFQNFINSDLNPEDVRSMCPLEGNTKVIYRILDKTIHVDSIERIYDLTRENKKVEVWNGFNWVWGKPNQMSMTDVYRITIDVGEDIIIRLGENHLQPIYESKTLLAEDLKKNMLLPFDKNYREKYGNFYNNSFISKNFKEPIKETKDFIYYPIKDIVREWVSKDQRESCNLYCFEVEDNSHLFMLANGLMTHNCRLRLDKREIIKKTGGLFGSGDLTGSIGVITINLARLGYLAKDKEQFFDLIKHYANIAKVSLEIKRKTLKYNLEHNMFPWSKRYLKQGFNGHFSTIGVVAGHEACLNFLGKDKGIDSIEGKELMIETLNLLRGLTIQYQEETENLYNLESTPAEGCTYRLAKLDRKHCPDIIQSGSKEIPFYTNSTQLPVDKDIDLLDAIYHQADIQIIYSGGVTFHTYLGESVEDPEVIKTLITRIFTKTKLPFLSITPTFSICFNHGYIRGEYEKCPQCEERTEIFSRVVGYYRKIASWNISKQEEFKNRKTFKIK
jgi:anaerobic ribonucleoside-triphosphate reductase